MNIDLADQIFSVSEFVLPALYNGVQLHHGAIISRRFEKGRPGVAGEYRPQIREGAGDHSTIYIHPREDVFKASKKPVIGDEVCIAEDLKEYEKYRVRGIRYKGGIYELLSEKDGSRIMNTNKGKVEGARRVSG